jgi:DNA-binding NarL/FixJ family response regulator
VLLVEDEALVRLTLAGLLEEADYKVLPVASAEEALEVLGSIPDIRAVVTDVELSQSGMTGFELARRVNDEHGLGVVALSGRVAPAEGELFSLVHFLAKPVHQRTLVQLVRDVIESHVSSGPAVDLERLAEMEVAHTPSRPSGSPTPYTETRTSQGSSKPELDAEVRHTQELTPRQQEVLELLVQGKSNRAIAEAMGLSENTVKVHLVAIYRVLGVSSRTEALLAGMRHSHHKARSTS